MPDEERSPLRPAEWRVLERLACGESNQQIAAALTLSPWTVKGHLMSIYRRLPIGDADNYRVGAVRWYLRHVPTQSRDEGVVEPAVWASLTAQQRAVLACLADGHTDAAIARGLGLALRTIKSHLTAIHQVMPRGAGRSKRVTAAVWYLREGRRWREEASGDA